MQPVSERILSLLHKTEEASLGRIYQHVMRAGEKPFAIFTAYRETCPPELNKKRFEELKSRLKQLKLGYNVLDGQWVNDCDQVVKEKSVFVVNITKRQLLKFLDDYKQEAGVYAGPETNGEIVLLDKKGKVLGKIGKFHPKKIGDMFSMVKGRPFTFR